MAHRSNNSDTSPRNRLRLFELRVAEIKRHTFVRSGQIEYMGLSVEESDRGPRIMRFRHPDEDDLRSFLLLFRQFVAEDEPVFLPKIFNICAVHLSNERLKKLTASTREAWQRLMNTGTSGSIGVVVGDEVITGKEMLDLWINGWYFHNDLDKQKMVEMFQKDSLPLERMMFLEMVAEVTRLILLMGKLVEEARTMGHFHYGVGQDS